MSDAGNETIMDKLAEMHLNTSSYEELTLVLTEITQSTKCDKNRQLITQPHWNTYIMLLVNVQDLCQKQSNSSEEFDFMIELLRCLRNSCIGWFREEHFINKNKDLFEIGTCILLQLIKRPGNDFKEITALKCCIQLFGNLVCQSNICKETVWDLFKKENLFRLLLRHKDLKVQEYSMMILYNCVTPEMQNYLTSTPEGQEIIIAVTDSLCENLTDWGVLLLEVLVNDVSFMDKCYMALPFKNRLLILDMYAQQLDSTDVGIPDSSLKFVKDLFNNYAMDIVKFSDSDSSDLQAVEIVKLLSLLCSASVVNHCSEVLKCCPDLLETAVDILKSVHLLGKSSCNAFSALNSLKDVNNLTKKEIEFHPAFGFKKNLIRLIGNLCSECKQNQDLVRKLDGIPLLLDCCNLDARNPFIMQWCILAIRNLLENNQDNQAVLASVSVTDDLVNSSLLAELGLRVEMSDGRPVLLKNNV